jgi:hypothetical protein
MKVFLMFIFLLPSALYPQQEMEKNLDAAYQNAKKGIYWALANIPEKKSRLETDLIADEKLYSSIKLDKQFNGIRIESKGFYNTTEISITIYRSDDGLLKDGYLKKPEEEKKTEKD